MPRSFLRLKHVFLPSLMTCRRFQRSHFLFVHSLASVASEGVVSGLRVVRDPLNFNFNSAYASDACSVSKMVVPSVAFLLAGLSLVQAFPFSDADALYGLQTRASSLVNCLYSKNVPISLSSSSNFAQLAEPYNLRLPYTPAAIALPTTPQHVSDAVLCASQAGTKVQAKSGGHSYASYSSGGQDGSLMIDLQSFQNISVDQSTGIAQVGGGVRLGNLALALHSQGGRALPHGTCPG